MGELANLNANRDPQLYLLQSLDPEALLTRLLGLLDGFVGAALRASDLPGWQVGHRTQTHQHLSVRWDGEDVAELILYSDRTTATPGNILPIAGMAIACAALFRCRVSGSVLVAVQERLREAKPSRH